MTTTPLMQWLQQVCPFPPGSLQEMAGDASFRRYFRLQRGEQSYVVMDAALQLDCCEPYVAVGKALHTLGVAVPEIMAYDLKQGYMLISDFGDRLYLKELHAGNADSLYQKAMDSLLLLQSCDQVKNWPLPIFTQAFIQKELDAFKYWFLEGYMQVPLSARDESMLQTVFAKLITMAQQQPQVFIHRDYHSANLMIIPDGRQQEQVGILDFQDACSGPVTYDLVSLLRDCYISWTDEQVYRWLSYYYDGLCDRKQLPTVSLVQFKQWFDWMGMQRHLKAAFIFARKYLRDHTTRYLQHLPRTLGYVVATSERYPELRDFHAYMRKLLLILSSVEIKGGSSEGLQQCVQ